MTTSPLGCARWAVSHQADTAAPRLLLQWILQKGPWKLCPRLIEVPIRDKVGTRGF